MAILNQVLFVEVTSVLEKKKKKASPARPGEVEREVVRIVGAERSTLGMSLVILGSWEKPLASEQWVRRWHVQNDVIGRPSSYETL